MKPQSFLREMANYVFKQFCAEMDAASLENLISIVATPNERAVDMVADEGDGDSGDESGEAEEEPLDVSEDSDDM